MKYTLSGPFFQPKYFTKSMYLLIADIFYAHIFSLKLVNSLKNTYLLEIGLFQKICFTPVKTNKN